MFGAEPKTLVLAEGSLERRFLAFVVEQHPFALREARAAFEEAGAEALDPDALRGVGDAVAAALARRLTLDDGSAGGGDSALPETTPFVPALERFAAEVARLEQAVRGFFEREAIAASFSADERRWMLEGILLTRAVDNRMKQLFLSGEMKYPLPKSGDDGASLGVQGKGFRSTGQEAIFAAGLRLRRGAEWAPFQGAWKGDVVAPLIRDLGLLLAFTDDVTLALNAQAGKAGPPLDGKDLHLGDTDRGVLWAAAPLTIATCTVVGQALAIHLRKESRVCFSFIGDGGSSIGEWHEAINLAAARKLPAVFCIENNQTALSTRVEEQSRVRVFAEKALGYGIPYVTLDGTDPEAIAAGFSWAAERARAGHGPVLIELVAMRMCGHAHHDDMLYLGGDPPLGLELPPTPDKGYVDAARYAAWAARDPAVAYARRLVGEGVITEAELAAMKARALARCDEAVADLKDRPWPPGHRAGEGVVSGGRRLEHGPPVAVPALPHARTDEEQSEGALPEATVDDAPPFDPKGNTYLDAVARGVGDVLAALPESFVLGEDVGPPYGNAFLLLRPLLETYGHRILNAPIAEGGIIGALVGAALEGMCPLGEMQFNDFVACGFNQLVNNAAKLRYRTGKNLPFVLRMPYGGLRRAGPYHSQDTSPWFYRSFGLKIVAPSTPWDARALFMTAARDPDPVLYYEHIALYRDPKIKQLRVSDDVAPAPPPVGAAAFRRLGTDLSLISYGAYVHKALRVAERLAAEDGVACDVLDLRWLSPLDWRRIEATVRRTGRVLLVGEDSRTGSILESIASRIGESLFEVLDGPVRVLGSLDAPVPYAPSLEDAFLLTEEHITGTARAMLQW